MSDQNVSPVEEMRRLLRQKCLGLASLAEQQLADGDTKEAISSYLYAAKIAEACDVLLFELRVVTPDLVRAVDNDPSLEWIIDTTDRGRIGPYPNYDSAVWARNQHGGSISAVKKSRVG